MKDFGTLVNNEGKVTNIPIYKKSSDQSQTAIFRFSLKDMNAKPKLTGSQSKK